MNPFWSTLARVTCRHSRAQNAFLSDNFNVKLTHIAYRPYFILSRVTRQWMTKRETSIQRDNKTQSSRIQNHLQRDYASQPDHIITSFDDLPRNYKDGKGLPFRKEALTKAEILEVFLTPRKVEDATRFLEIVHGRRVAGTLGDPLLYKNNAPTLQILLQRCLDWLRKNVPVDEDYNAGRRAELELLELDPEAFLSYDPYKLYVPNSRTENASNPYGKSVLETVRKTQQKQREAKRRRERELKERETEQTAQRLGLPAVSNGADIQVAKQPPSPRLQYYLERAKILPDLPPEMTPFQRLWPSVTFAILVLAGCVGLATYYTPSKRSARLWPDVPPSASTVGGLIIANIIILGLWHHPPAFRMLNRYFVSVPGSPNPFAAVGGFFSHQKLHHLGANMITLWLAGTRLHDDVGRGNFLAIYFASGTMSSIGSLVFHTFTRRFAVSSIGASGAVCGVVGAYLWLNLWQPLRLFGVFPPRDWPTISGAPLLALLVLCDWRLARNWKGYATLTDHHAHLAGYAAGITGAQLVKWRVMWKRRKMQERRKALEF